MSQPDVSNVERYPRPAWFRAIRFIFRLSWLAFLIYPGNVIFNLYALVADKGINGLFDASNLEDAFLIRRLLSVLASSPSLVLPPLVGIGAIIWIGRLAHRDWVRESDALSLQGQKEQRLREEAELRIVVQDTARAVAERHVSSMTLAANSLYDPKGPPFDEALLLSPDHFVGRVEELDWLTQRLRAGGTVGITALRGMGGIGKTALAAIAVKMMREENDFPDGIGVVLCENLDDSIDVFHRILSRFDPHRRFPESRDIYVLTELAHQLLDGKAALAVFDNVEPSLDIEMMVLPLKSTGITILLTARQTLASNIVAAEGVRTLGLLSPDEALEHFAHSFGVASLQALTESQQAAARRIVNALGYHTLAIKVVARYAADLQRDLTTLADEIADPQEVLEMTEGETPRYIENVLAKSVGALNPETQRLFAALSAFATADLGRHALLAVARGIGLASPEASVTLLVRRALIDAAINQEIPESSDRERVRLHPLLRAFAATEFSHWLQAEVQQTRFAVAKYYAEYVNVTFENPLIFDEPNIIGALEWAQQYNQAELVATLSRGMMAFWRDRGQTQESLRYLPWGIAALDALAGQFDAAELRLLESDLTYGYATALRDTGQYDKADGLFRENLALRREIGDAASIAATLTQFAQMIKDRGELDEAEQLLNEAVPLFHAAHDEAGESNALIILGQINRLRGQFGRAESFYTRCLSIRQAVHDLQGEAWVLAYLGDLAQARGDLVGAEGYYQQVLQLGKVAKNERRDGLILDWLGQVALTRGDDSAAEKLFAQALQIDLQTRSRREEGMISFGRGQIAVKHDTYDTARSLFAAARGIFVEVVDPQGEAMVDFEIGKLSRNEGQLDVAEASLRQALSSFEQIQDMYHYCEVAHSLALFLAEQRGDNTAACHLAQSTLATYQHLDMPGVERFAQLAATLQCSPGPSHDETP